MATRRGVSSLALLAIAAGVLACEPAPAQIRAASHGILGGRDAPDDRAVVGILSRHQDDVGTYYTLCSGSLIAPTLVLTARHCVADNPDGIVCGVTQFGATDPPDIHHVTPDLDGPAAQSPSFSFQEGTWFGVEAVIPSEGTRVCGNDIALVRLDGVVPGEVATPIEPRIAEPPEIGEGYRAVGFGASTTDDEGLGRRRQIDGQEVACAGNCPSYLDDESEFEGGIGTCIGDSGGPALDARGRVIGVSSRSDPDCTGSIYTSVHAWGDWLSANAVEAAALGGYPVPQWAARSAMDAGAGSGDGAVDAADAGDDDEADGSAVAETASDEAGRSGCACESAPSQRSIAGSMPFGLVLVVLLRRGRKTQGLVSSSRPKAWPVDPGTRCTPRDPDAPRAHGRWRPNCS